jgi:hypothetical protein
MPPERELSLVQELERPEAALLERRCLGCDRLAADIAESGPVPESESGVKLLRRIGRTAACKGLRPSREEPLEAVEVELAGCEPQAIPGATGLDPLGTERQAEAVNVDLERLSCRSRRRSAPELIDEALAGERLIRVEEQHGQKRALFRRPERDGTLIVGGLDRPE